MNPERITELLDPFLHDDVAFGASPPKVPGVPQPGASFAQGRIPRLTPVQLDQISTYIDLLLHWNARINLTAIRAPDEIVTRHFGESLFAARHLLYRADTPRGADTLCGADTLVRDPCGAHTPVRVPQVAPSPSSSSGNSAPPWPNSHSPQTPAPDTADDSPYPRPSDQLVDLGSGAGFPGLPMKIWSPQTRVTLIESNHKKVAFLREVIRALTLTGINVFLGRAEDFPAASASLLTLRAVERFDSTLATANSLVAAGGRLALLISQAQIPRAQSLAPSLRWSSFLTIPRTRQRVLLVGHK